MSRVSTPPLPLHNEPPSGLRSSRSSSPFPRATTSSSITSTYSLLPPDETADRLQTSLTLGLSPSEAEYRLIQDGPNELPQEKPEPLWLRFLKQFKETLILLLLCSAGISFFMGNLDDALSITLAVTIVVTVGFVQEYRSEKSLEALSRLVPHYAHIRRGGTRQSVTSNGPVGTYSTELDPLANSPTFGSSGKLASTISASQLVTGDFVLFSTGDRIPADIRITQASDLTIDESNLTGENEPVVKSSDVLEATEPTKPKASESLMVPSMNLTSQASVERSDAGVRLNDQSNIAFMGTLVRSGYGQGIVIATGANTEFGRISISLQEIEAPRTPLQQSMDHLGKQLSYMSFAVIGLIMLIGLIQGKKILDLFTIGVSLAVAAIPEGLPIIVTVTLALGVLRMAKHGAIVRKLPSVETLGSVNVVCSDKTGTLTLNHMTVTQMWHFDADIPFGVDKEIVGDPGPATRTVFRIGNIANNARLSGTSTNADATASSAAILSSTQDQSSSVVKSRWMGQQTDVALLDMLDTFGEDDVRERIGPRVGETPFSSERKWMGVIIGNALSETPNAHVPSQEVAYIKGALEQVLRRCDTYLTKDGREIILDDARRQEAMKAANSMADEGLRVIGFASGTTAKRQTPGSRTSTPRPGPDRSHIPSEKTREDDGLYNGLVFAGMVGMNDPPRKDVHKSIRRLMAGGVKVIMITGDAEATAVAIAKKLGMPINTSHPDAKPVLRGDELDHMTEEELAQAIVKTSIFARTSPEHKMKIIRALQFRGDVVAMTGDGVNDAPALKKADIGISMGLLGTDVAKEAADMILTDDDFSTILRAIEQGKGIFYNIQNFITFQLSTSVAALSLILISTTFGFKNPLNAMQILWINILMDGPPAQSLGVEPVDPRIMTLPPRSRTAPVLTKALIRRVLTSASLIMLGTIAIYIRGMVDDSPVSSSSSSSGSYISSVGSTHQTSSPSSKRVVTRRDTTMTFTAFVLFDMFNALNCRSEAKSILSGELPLFSNKMFNYAVAGSLMGQLCVIYLPFLQRVFQTEALSAWDFVPLIGIASSVFWVDEGRKFWGKRRRRMNVGVGYSTRV